MSTQHAPTDSMAIDQYGTTYHGLGKHPRKVLMERLDRKSAQKIYRDNKDGSAHHVGWIVGKHWCSVYHVTPMRDPA